MIDIHHDICIYREEHPIHACTNRKDDKHYISCKDTLLISCIHPQHAYIVQETKKITKVQPKETRALLPGKQIHDNQSLLRHDMMRNSNQQCKENKLTSPEYRNINAGVAR